MVGIFSRFSVSRNGHRRTQSALDLREVVPTNAELTTVATVDGDETTHGIEVAVEFKPIEHPTEPLDYDQPIQCPLPEPSILNDGRIWKERVYVGSQSGRFDLVITQQEGAGSTELEPGRAKLPRLPSNRRILPSVSAPEHNILQLLEECNASGIEKLHGY